MSDNQARPPRWPTRLSPTLAELRELHRDLPALATEPDPVARFRLAQRLLDRFSELLHTVRDDAVYTGTRGGAGAYRAFAAAAGLSVGGVNKRVTAHNARSNGGQP